MTTTLRIWIWLICGWIFILAAGLSCHGVGSLLTNTTLAWDPKPGVTFGIYSGTNSRQYNILAMTSRTSYTVSNQVIGRRYYYAGTSIAPSGLESQYSPEITAIAGDTNVYEYLTNYLPWYQPQYSTNLQSTNWLNFGNAFGGGFTNAMTAVLRFKWLSNQIINVVILTNPPVDTNLSVNLKPPMPTQ